MNQSIQNIDRKTVNPIFDADAVPIIISLDDNYCLSATALINSIVANSSADKNYDIVILEERIREENKSRLLLLLKGKENFSLRFFDINKFSEIRDGFTYGHFSLAMYSRLFIPKIFKNYTKVIFIDSDTIVCCDLSELLNLDLSDKLIAAVRDLVMEGLVKFKVKSIPNSGGQEASVYLKNKINIQDHKKYFQSGLIVFNIPKIVSEKKDDELIKSIGASPLWFPDQDILNKVFYNKVNYLPLSWNVYNGNGNTNGFFPKLSSNSYKEYLEARKNPKVIHYAGDQKPWVNKNVDFYDEFYKNIAGTEWERDLEDSLKNVNLLRKLKSKITPFVNDLLPIGSNRRVLLRNAYYRLNSFLEK